MYFNHLLPKDRQEAIEHKYSKHNIKGYVEKELDSLVEELELVKEKITEFLGTEFSYDSKNKRLAQIDPENLDSLIREFMCVLLMVEKEELITVTCGRLAVLFDYEEIKDRLTTAGEFLVIFAECDLVELFKENSRYYVYPLYQISDRLKKFIENTKYLPPMVVEPQELTSNRGSGYLTKTETLLLGKNNHHNDDICLDVINKFNKVKLSLNVPLLKVYSECPPRKPKDKEQEDRWKKFFKESYEIYLALVKGGNCFWLTHKRDKRGRLYAQGYHVNYQGTEFKKAIIQLHKKEIIE